VFDPHTLAEFLHHSTSETLMVLGDLVEEQPEDPYARALLAEANRLLVAHSLRLSLFDDRPYVRAALGLPPDLSPVGESARALLMAVIRGAGPPDAMEDHTVRHAREEIRLLTAQLANWACLRPTGRPDHV
jgi:hypothetical protein